MAAIGFPNKRTILQILQDVSNELGLPAISSVVGSTDTTTKQLFAFAHRIGDDLLSRYEWPQLIRQNAFTTVASTAVYPVPSDFDRFIPRTFWDRTNNWELIGPLTPQEWQWLKSGSVSSFPRTRFRILRYGENASAQTGTPDIYTNFELELDPTPSSADSLVYEYQSGTWILPRQWTASTAYSTGEYISTDDNIYIYDAGGTSGATAPTGGASGGSDGTATISSILSSYNRFLADTDYPLIDPEIINLGVQWRFLRQKGLNYQEIRADYETMVIRQANAVKTAPTLDLTRSSNPRFISVLNIPDTGFG